MMRVIHDLSEFRQVQPPVVLAAGAFDGVHVGHRSVIREAQALATQHQGETWALTFDPHPMKLLRPEKAPALLTSTPHKLRLMGALGLHGVAVIPFTEDFARLSPETFVEQLRRSAPTLRAMVVGENFTFGHRARGNTDLLRSLGDVHHFEVRAAAPVTMGGEAVSSTRIRRAVGYGHLEEAARMLGRPFSILGTVVSGKKLGRTLGFPTANVNPHNEVRPPPGIYATRVEAVGRSFLGAAYLGGRRTHPHNDVVEVHLLDADVDIYGQEILVSFVKKLRDDHAFPSLESLSRQIAKDVEHARSVLAVPKEDPGPLA